MISRNNLGVQVTGTVQYNQFENNTTAISPQDGQLIAHNVFADNVNGLKVAGRDDVRIFANTFVSHDGKNIWITGNSTRTEIRNNILKTETGYGIYVDDDSTTGFFSDYNTLVAGNGGHLVYWTKNFDDILDWQEDVYQFDLHSQGTTAVNPRSAQPAFISRALGDYRVFAPTARLNFTSPTVDAGDLLADQARGPGFQNLLSNPSFESGVTGWTVAPTTANIGDTDAYDGAAYFRAGTSLTTGLEQTVDLVASALSPPISIPEVYCQLWGACSFSCRGTQ